MSLLPGQIIPQTVPFGRVNEDGTVTIEKNWWLLLYHIILNTLGTGQGLPGDALQDLESADTDAIDADAIALRQPIQNLQALLSDFMVSSADLPDIARALLLAQDSLLPDPTALSQPVSAITVAASPFTFTTAFPGTVSVTGGIVTAISIIRRGTSIATGLVTGLVPVSRYDQVQVTYTGLPTMTFIPWSSQ